MLLCFRHLLLTITIASLALVPTSQAAVSQNFSPKERAMAGLLLFLLMENGYQPSYGFSQSHQDDRVSVLLSIVGGHTSTPNPSQTSGVTITGSGTLTLGGNHGYWDSLGSLTLTDSGIPGLSAGPGNLLSFSNGNATTWNSSTLTIPSWTSSSSDTGLVADQLPNLNVLTFINPSGSYSIDYSSSWTTGTGIVLVPEPSALLLGSITGSLALLRRRRTC